MWVRTELIDFEKRRQTEKRPKRNMSDRYAGGEVEAFRIGRIYRVRAAELERIERVR